MKLEGQRLAIIGVDDYDLTRLVEVARAEYSLAAISPFESFADVSDIYFLTHTAAIINLNNEGTLPHDMKLIESAHEKAMALILLVNMPTTRGGSARDTLVSMGIQIERTVQARKLLRDLDKQLSPSRR